MDMSYCPQNNRFSVSQFMAKYDQYVSQKRFDNELPVSGSSIGEKELPEFIKFDSKSYRAFNKIPDLVFRKI